MAKSFVFHADLAGYNALRNSAEIMSECDKYAQRVRDAAGEGFIVVEKHYPRKGGSVVRANSKEAYYRALNGNVLEIAKRAIL